MKVTIKRRGMRRLFGGWFQDHDTRIAIQVPTRTDVRLSTSGGSVDASRVTGAVNVHTSGGSVRVEAIEGNVEGTTSGGGIRMRTYAATSSRAHRRQHHHRRHPGKPARRRERGRGRRSTTSPATCAPRRAAAVWTCAAPAAASRPAARAAASRSGSRRVTRAAASCPRLAGRSEPRSIPPHACQSTRAHREAASTQDVPVTIQGKINNDSLRGEMNGGGPAAATSFERRRCAHHGGFAHREALSQRAKVWPS